MKPPIGYHPQGLAQNHLQMHPQIGESKLIKQKRNRGTSKNKTTATIVYIVTYD